MALFLSTLCLFEHLGLPSSLRTHLILYFGAASFNRSRNPLLRSLAKDNCAVARAFALTREQEKNGNNASASKQVFKATT